MKYIIAWERGGGGGPMFPRESRGLSKQAKQGGGGDLRSGGRSRKSTRSTCRKREVPK